MRTTTTYEPADIARVHVTATAADAVGGLAFITSGNELAEVRYMVGAGLDPVRAAASLADVLADEHDVETVTVELFDAAGDTIARAAWNA